MHDRETRCFTEAQEGFAWRKSKHSADTSGDCVEIACPEKLILVRDSKFRNGTPLSFPCRHWVQFLDAIDRTIR
jgi:hypothetical protein